MRPKHFNLMNIMSNAAAALKGLMSPAETASRRLQWRLARLARYAAKNASYPYSSTRQNTRSSRPNRWGRAHGQA